MNIGILGGTFDPIHNAHVQIAKSALEQFHLDKVWIMPTPNPPHKNKGKIAGNFHRVNMIKLAIKDIENVEFSDFELNRSDVTYTADTLSMLKELHPENNYFFIIGSDSALSFSSWYRPDIILKFARLLVVRRKDESFDYMDDIVAQIEEKFNTEIGIIKMDSRIESSSDIRNDIEASKDMLSNDVYKYIIDNKLYMVEKNNAWSQIKIIEDLKACLKASRYEHTINVADKAKDMAEHFNVNPNKAYYAGLLHDCAKNLSDTELLDICAGNELPVSEKEKKSPYLLHGKVGAYLAKTKYGIEDDEILSAITWHTTGKADMTTLEKIIFSADYIEPGRKKQPNLDYLREISNKDLDLLVYSILKDTIEYLDSLGDDSIEEHTLEAFEFYKQIIEAR